jgi:hypothetical protein
MRVELRPALRKEDVVLDGTRLVLLGGELARQVRTNHGVHKFDLYIRTRHLQPCKTRGEAWFLETRFTCLI